MTINGVGTCNENSSDKWRICENQLPKRWIVVGPKLELCVEVEEQVHQSGKGGSRLAAWARCVRKNLISFL